MLRSVLKTEADWIQGEFARDGRGKACRESDRHADRFCLVGAIERIYDSVKEPMQFRNVYQRLLAVLNRRGYQGKLLSSYNDADTTTFDDICELIAEAGV